METVQRQMPAQEQIEQLTAIVQPFILRKGYKSKGWFAHGPEVVEGDSTTPKAVGRSVLAWFGRKDTLPGDHRHALWALELAENNLAYDGIVPMGRYLLRHHFVWDEQGVYRANRFVRYGGVATQPLLESELESLHSFDPYLEFDVKPIFRSFNEITNQDTDQLIQDIDTYSRRAITAL